MNAKRSGRPCQETAAQVVTTTETNGTARRPRPVSLVGPRLLHDLVRNGYRITTVCVACGAPLTSPQSVARQLGPVCARQVAA